MKKKFKAVFASACLGMLLFGIMLTTLGSILPEIIPRFGISKADAGSLFMVMNFGILGGSFVFGPIVDRFGYKSLLVVSSGLLLIGIEGVAFAPSFELFSIFVFVFGFGGGAINGAVNAVVSDISGDGRSAGLALLGAFFGLGAFGVPILLGLLLDLFTYTQVIAYVGFVVLIAMAVFLAVEFPSPKQPHGIPLKEMAGLVKDPTLLLLAFILFFQSGVEITTGGWTAAYFNEVLGIDSARAIFLLSFFWIGMMVSRLLISKLLLKGSPAVILLISIGIAMLSSVVMIFTSNISVATVAVCLMGAGFGACFPVVLGYVGNLYPKMSGTAFSFAFTIALTGGMLMPYIAGILGDLFGLQASFLIVPGGLMVISILFGLAVKRFVTIHKETIKP